MYPKWIDIQFIIYLCLSVNPSYKTLVGFSDVICIINLVKNFFKKKGVSFESLFAK